MIVGFAGTQQSPTARQEHTLREILEELYSLVNELHHGDCIGADALAHNIAVNLGYGIVQHPPLNEAKRAFCTTPDMIIRDPKEYLERNRDIVDETTVLVAIPLQDIELVRSGTWSTVLYARRLRRPIWIIRRDGTIKREGQL
jgi:hypothetical protein